MGTVSFPQVDAKDNLESLKEIVAEISQLLDFAINGNLDVKNIRAQSITADRMNVDQLSAIAADLGTITAGIIYGAYIATSNGTYPRIEFSSVGRLLTAYSDALNKVDITPSAGGSPGVTWTVAGSTAANLQAASFGVLLSSFGSVSDITLQPGRDINLNLSVGKNLYVDGSQGQSTTISYVNNVVAGVPSFGTMTFKRGILTSFT